MKLEVGKLLLSFTAAVAITKGQAVYISAAGSVSPATDANAGRVIGVANADAAAGASVEVIVYGLAEVVADGAIAVGDNVRAAATAGRIVAENSLTPVFTGDALATHGHTALSSGGADILPAADQSLVGGDGVDTTLLVGVDVAAQAAVSVPTSANSAGTPSGTNTAIGHGRIVGKALSAAAIAGDIITILVCLS